MTNNRSDLTHHVAIKRRKCKFRTFSGIVGICLILYLNTGCSKSSGEKTNASQNHTFAELLSAKGTVLLLKAGQTSWQEVPIGVPLMNGDLIQTGVSGNAVIRYPNGTTASIQAQTIFAIQRTGNNEMEILMPFETHARGAQSAGIFKDPPAANQASNGLSLERAKAGQLRPALNLQRMIPFGRSIELIGHVEPGSSLTVNGETVEVGGDGSFKHFTNPFPKSAERVYLVMKATNLAGRDSILTTTYDFVSQVGGN